MDIRTQNQDNVFDDETGNYTQTDMADGKCYRGAVAKRGAWPGARVAGYEIGCEVWRRVPIKASRKDQEEVARDLAESQQRFVELGLIELDGVDICKAGLTEKPAFQVRVTDLGTGQNVTVTTEVG